MGKAIKRDWDSDIAYMLTIMLTIMLIISVDQPYLNSSEGQGTH